MLYVTFPDKESAQRCCDHLVSNKQIACYNLMPIEACYWWEGEMNHDNEYVAIAKTLPKHTSNISRWLDEHHPYDTPCIIHWEVKANQKYVDWIKDSVK